VTTTAEGDAASSYTLEQLAASEGLELGRSPWLSIDQERIDAFAVVTQDSQWIHVDPARAAEGPYGATIAHGYLLLSLLPMLVSQSHRIDHVGRRINYGLDKVRFPSPVLVGSRIRAVVTVRTLIQMSGGVRLGLRCALEIDGEPKPGCVAETLTLLLP
jgi:acyl dehydratase